MKLQQTVFAAVSYTHLDVYKRQLRDIACDDLEKALQTASQIGYKAVEFAGFYDCPAAQVKEWLQKYDLKAWGSHISPDDLAGDLDRLIAYHKELGCTNMGLSSMFFATKDELEASIALVNEVNERLTKEGLTLYFHNHYWDHAPNRQNQIPFWELVTRTDIKFELDTYWAFIGGLDPVTMMKWLKAVSYTHLSSILLPTPGSIETICLKDPILRICRS